MYTNILFAWSVGLEREVHMRGASVGETSNTAVPPPSNAPMFSQAKKMSRSSTLPSRPWSGS